MSIFSRVSVPVLIAVFCFAGPPVARAQSAAAGSEQPSEETWNSIKGDIFKDRAIRDGAGLVVLDAPRRAEDAAVVPIGMRVNFAAGDDRTLQSLTLVIDENPAPAAANADATKSMLGQMKFRAFHLHADALPEAQIMLRHPQNSGLQMDQLTRLYVPPFFIENLKIWEGNDLVMAMEGGIAISEDPNSRFNYRPY